MRNSDLIFKLSDPYYNETLKKGAVTNQEELFGHIVLNKMVGIAFKKLDHRDLNPELRKTFYLLNANYLNGSVLYKKQLKYLASVLSIAN